MSLLCVMHCVEHQTALFNLTLKSAYETGSVAGHTLNCVRHFVTPWTVVHQAPVSMELSRQNTGVGSWFFTIWATREAQLVLEYSYIYWSICKITFTYIVIPFPCEHKWGIKPTDNSVNVFDSSSMWLKALVMLILRQDSSWGREGHERKCPNRSSKW